MPTGGLDKTAPAENQPTVLFTSAGISFPRTTLIAEDRRKMIHEKLGQKSHVPLNLLCRCCWRSLPSCCTGKTQHHAQIFPEKELSGLSPNFHIYVSVRDLYILLILLQESMWTDPGNI